MPPNDQAQLQGKVARPLLFILAKGVTLLPVSCSDEMDSSRFLLRHRNVPTFGLIN